LQVIGPGLAIAATGVGAGDLVAATVSGARFGFAVAWAALVGAILKFTLNEGLARWQLATGTTLLEGWVRHLGPWVRYAFLVYLLIWSFVVGGALISACGLAAHALAPGLSVTVWGLIHSAAGIVVVLAGGYAPFERLIKLFIGLMSVTLIGAALLVAPPAESLARTFSEASIPAGGVKYILGVIGGVGGSVTLLSYGYWIRERGWEGRSRIGTVRLDLAVAYGLTGAFGLAVMVLAGQVLHRGGVVVTGNSGVLRMAEMLVPVVGPFGRSLFLVGFWGAVATSLLGVWQGVPYLFCDFVRLLRRESAAARVRTGSIEYRGFLLWLGVLPATLMFFDRPVQLIIVYSVLGALFMPFLAATLLYMNSRSDWVGPEMRNGPAASILLALCLALFAVLGWVQLSGMFD